MGRWTLHDSENRCAIIGAVSRKGTRRIASDKGRVQGRNSIMGFVRLPPTELSTEQAWIYAFPCFH